MDRLTLGRFAFFLLAGCLLGVGVLLLLVSIETSSSADVLFYQFCYPPGRGYDCSGVYALYDRAGVMGWAGAIAVAGGIVVAALLGRQLLASSRCAA